MRPASPTPTPSTSPIPVTGYSYNLIQNQRIKLVKIIMDDLNISLADRIKQKKIKTPGIKIDYKQPYYLKTFDETNLLIGRSFSLNFTFKSKYLIVTLNLSTIFSASAIEIKSSPSSNTSG